MVSNDYFYFPGKWSEPDRQTNPCKGRFEKLKLFYENNISLISKLLVVLYRDQRNEWEEIRKVSIISELWYTEFNSHSLFLNKGS